MLKYKKMFSFPWIIKEIREILFNLGSGYNNINNNDGKNGNGFFYDKDGGGYNKKYKGNNIRFNNSFI